MKRYLAKLLSEVLGNMFANGQIAALPEFELSVARENFGDYSTNVAFSIARAGKFNAGEIGEIIAREIKELDKDKLLSEIKVQNGFINFYLEPLKIGEYLAALQKEIKIDSVNLGKKIIFEYSSPNTNKPLHIGHTRNDVYGMACINLLRTTAAEVISCEVLNDRGIHIMKSILMYMIHGQGMTPETEKIKADHFVGKFYQMFAVEVQKNPNLEVQAQELLQKWESGDDAVRQIWKLMNSWFYQGVKETYQREGSFFDAVQYESDIYDKGRNLVLQGLEKGVFKQEEDGSVFVDLTDENLDKKYLLRKDGTTIYITQDLYLWDFRNKEFQPDAAFVTTSSEQSYHFNVLKKIFKLLGYAWADDFVHLPYEHVFLGKNKMSSRTGNAISADELLTMVKERVRTTMLNSKKIKGSEDDQDLVEAIAFAAIKYGYLKYDNNTKIYFDLDETVAVEGNTGPYLQYTFARIKSILRKAGSHKLSAPSALKEPSELALARQLLFYNDSVVSAAKEFKPNTLTNYLFELAAKFNTFYDQVLILSTEDQSLREQRLSLIASAARVLEHGLGLLGIKAPEEI